MPLDPQMQAYLDKAAAVDAPPIYKLTPEIARQEIRAELVIVDELEPVAHVENRVISGPLGEIPLRIYTPAGNGPFPLLVFFHGGGWVIGDLDTHDSVCRSLTNGVGCIVVSVGYRRAPEYKFPAAPHDCYTALQWVAQNAALLHGDPERIAVGGDSAGGNLAAVVALMARDQKGPRLCFQLLIYPVTDLTASAPSIIEYAEGYGLTRQDMIWFTNHYLPSNDEQKNPLASPLFIVDLSALPPTLVITAEYDLLRDEGEQYGQRLQEAGVPVTITRYPGAIHGFVSRPFDQGKQAMIECSHALQNAFLING